MQGVNITPGSQTLILAGEGRNPTRASDAPSGKTAASNGAVLQRLTIVASQPDTTLVYVQADYATLSDAALNAYAVDDSPSSSTALTASSARPTASRPTTGRDTSLSSYLRPVEQYARTQSILNDPAPSRIDVHA